MIDKEGIEYTQWLVKEITGFDITKETAIEHWSEFVTRNIYEA